MRVIDEIKQFTYDAYVTLLNYLSEHYNIISFNQVHEAKKPYLLIRHDVDASIDHALKMAKIEEELGISSTYFLLFSNRFYNLLEKNTYQKLLNLVEFGREIGLHYDLEVYDNYNLLNVDYLENEIKLLSLLTKKDINLISVHNPSINNKEDPYAKSSKYINTYNKDMYDLYVTDSCRSWYMDDLEKLINFESDRVQLVIHPLLWNQNKINSDELIDAFLADQNQSNITYGDYWKNVWRNHEKVIEYVRRL